MKRKRKTGLLVCSAMILLSAYSVYSIFSEDSRPSPELVRAIEKAEYHEQKGAYITAAKYYKEAVVYDENNTELILKAAENSLLCEDEENFEKYCLMAQEKGCYEAYMLMAEKYMDDGDVQSAYMTLSGVSEDFLGDDGKKLKYRLKYATEESFSDFDDAKGFHDGLCAVKTDDGWCLADKEGYIKGRCVFDDAGAYCSEYDIFPVCKNGEWFFADINGNRKYVFKSSYSYLGAFSEGYAPFCDGKKYGYVNLDYTETSRKYDFAGAFLDGVAAVSEGGRWYLVDSSFDRTCDEYFDMILTDRYGFCVQNGVIRVMKNGKEELRDISGKPLSEEKTGISGLRLFSDGNLYGFKDENGDTAIEPEFDEAVNFSENGSTCVRKGENWFVIRLVNFGI